jgi:hypothetical protein
MQTPSPILQFPIFSMKKTLPLLTIFILNTLFFILNTGHAQAEGVSLSTFPTTLQLRAQPPADIRSGFSIQNKGTETVRLTIQLKPFKADAASDGKVQYLENDDPALLKKVQVIDDGFAVSSIELGPNQTKNLSLRVKLDAGEPINDYYFSVIFLSDEANPQSDTSEDATALSIAQSGIALNVLLGIGPKELPQGTIEEFSTLPYRDSGPVPFTIKVQNKGPHFMTPKGVILIRNIFGQTVGRIDLHNTNILAGTGRSLIGTPYQLSAKNPAAITSSNLTGIQDTSSKAVWPERFLLGIYTADLSLALSEDGPVFNQTIRFIAFPSKFLIALGITAIFILLIALRVRKTVKRT